MHTQHPLAGNRLDAGDILAQIAQLLHAFVLPQLHLEAQAKELLGRLPFLVLQLFIVQVANLFRFHCSSSLVLSGYLTATATLDIMPHHKSGLEGQLVRSQAHRLAAISGVTPSISKSTLPGRTTATQ